MSLPTSKQIHNTIVQQLEYRLDDLYSTDYENDLGVTDDDREEYERMFQNARQMVRRLVRASRQQ